MMRWLKSGSVAFDMIYSICSIVGRSDLRLTGAFGVGWFALSTAEVWLRGGTLELSKICWCLRRMASLARADFKD